MASPEESEPGAPRPPRRARDRPPETPVEVGAPSDPDPSARRLQSPRSLEHRLMTTVVELPVEHSRRGARRTGIRVRRFPYAYWPRPSRPSRQPLAEEHAYEVSSGDLGSGLVGTETGGESSGDYAGHPGPQRAETRIRLRQSFLYSDRPRRFRPKRPAPSEEHPSMVDMPRFEELSLSERPLSTPQTADEMREETDDDELYNEAGDDEVFTGPVGFGFLGPQTLRYRADAPRPKWLGGIRGQAILGEHGDDVNSGERSPMVTDSSRPKALPVTQSTEEKSTGDPDDDTEEQLRLLEEYFAARPPVRMSEAFDRLKAAEHRVLTALAVKRGRKPPPPLTHFLADQAQQEASSETSHPRHSTVHRKPRHVASTEEIIENAKKWMYDEVMLVFQKYIERRDDLKIVDYQLDELSHQCVNVESYNKLIHHYNFMVKLKKANSDDWAAALYFAEVKQMFGRKSYFCCALEPNENGLCYACQNQGVDDLKHPAMGGFDMGCPWPDPGFNLWYTDE